MRLFRLAVVFLPLLLAACGLTPQEKEDYAVVQQSGIDPAVYDKMVQGDDLSLSDVKELSRARVGDDITLRYMRNQKTVYYLTNVDVGALRKACVSPGVIDYMLQTPREFASYYPAIGAGFGYFPDYDPFWGPPYPNYPYPEHYRR
jgi:hypothetical protein